MIDSIFVELSTQKKISNELVGRLKILLEKYKESLITRTNERAETINNILKRLND